MKNICQGCYTYERPAPDNCIIFLNHDQKKCPCTKCLIKMVCETPCEEVKDLWYSGVNRIRRKL